MPRTELDIDMLVPHRPPMRLIEEVLDVTGDMAITTATVAPSWPTFSGGAAHVLLLVELVAQTAAVVGGYKAATQPSGTRMRQGMLVGIKNAEFKIDRLPLNSRITTCATTRALLEDFKEIKGYAKIEDQVIGEVNLHGVQVAYPPGTSRPV